MSTPTPQTLSLALSMIDRRAWQLKSRALEMVRFVTVDAPDLPKDGYRLIPNRMASELLYGKPGSHRNAGKILDALVADRVLDRLEGIGSRAHAYRINGAFAQWKNVEWCPTPEFALLRLNAFAVRLDTARTSVSAVPWDTAQDFLVPSSRTRHKNSVVPFPRTRQEGGASAVPWDTAQIRSEATDSYLSGEMSVSNPLLLTESERETVGRIVRAVKSKTKSAFLEGAPKALVVDLVQRGADVDEVIAFVGEIPEELKAPKAAEWLWERWVGRHDAVPPSSSHSTEEVRRDLEARRSNAVRQLRTWEEDEDSDEILKWKSELADVDEKLAKLDFSASRVENDERSA